jgi:predicted glycosyltransferase
MKIWVDACTGKHVRYASAIAKRLRSLNHQPILTTREHPDTLALANSIGEKFAVVGEYDPASTFTKLRASINRELQFCEMFKPKVPDLAISHQSVEACRVAFGLGVPIVATADAPHAEAVNRLTLQLSNVLVISKAIPKRCYQVYGSRKIVQFNGVDEGAWIKGFKPKISFEEYGEPLIVVRQMETRASYAQEKTDATEQIARKLTSIGKVIFLPRYDKHQRKALIVPQKFLDSASLAAKADLVVTVGGTLAREAALQGTPSIVIPLIQKTELYYTNNYISKLGFPLFTVNSIEEVMKQAKKNIGEKWKVKEMLNKLENPIDVIERIVEVGEYE